MPKERAVSDEEDVGRRWLLCGPGRWGSRDHNCCTVSTLMHPRSSLLGSDRQPMNATTTRNRHRLHGDPVEDASYACVMLSLCDWRHRSGRKGGCWYSQKGLERRRSRGMLHNYCSHAHSTRRTHRREVPLSSMFRVIDPRNPFWEGL